MSLTLTKVNGSEDVWGRTRTTLYDITYDSSYPLTAGYVINAQDVGLKNFLSAHVEGGNKAAGAILPMFDFGTPAGIPATSVIARLFLPTGGAAAPATLTAPVAVGATGATPVTSSAATVPVVVTAGIGKEVGNTTDVSSVIVRVRFFGI